MLNEWTDRDPEPRQPQRWHRLPIVVLGALVLWGLWSAIAG